MSNADAKRSVEPVLEAYALGVPSAPTTASATIRRSALWAAWGDALGFVTELAAAPEEVRRRAGVESVSETLAWKRRIGGRFGPEVEFPAGTYSDDTQLRLATSRSIRSDGRFDIEAFSKVELPVFLCYALGAGRGTREAAGNLAKRDVRWFSNFFEARHSSYVQGGGNGAAMRIHPHVWSARSRRKEEVLVPVLMNSVVTHGHPHGLVGATFHALALESTLHNGELPPPERWPRMLSYLESLPQLLGKSSVLADRWLPMWQERAGRRFDAELTETLAEGGAGLSKAVELADSPPEEGYRRLMSELGGRDPHRRGSGLLSATASLAAAWLFRDNPAKGIRCSANLLGSDTDTIASMTGALLGVISGEDPPGSIADREYIVAEADRMAAIAHGEVVKDFPHPDRLHWRPPRVQVDAIGTFDGGLAVAGLGPARPESSEFTGSNREDTVWQWLQLDFGQAVLARRRRQPKPLPDTARLVQRQQSEVAVPPTLFDNETPGLAKSAGRLTVDRALAEAQEARFSEPVLGRLLHQLARGPSGRTDAAAFAALVAERLEDRSRRRDPR